MERTLITVPTAIPMVALIGPHDDNLRAVEAAFPSVNITVRGNEITLRGPHIDCLALENLFGELMVVIRSGNVLTVDAVARSIAMLESKPVDHPAEVLSLNIVSNRGRSIRPKTANQKRYVDAIEDHTITFGIGPAGTGKTYLAMAKAVSALQAKKVNRIILTRPAVEAGEHLGFLPGTLNEKIDPYLRPLFDALHDMIDIETIPRMMQSGIIEVAPLAYMRGRTLNDAFIILDEAQNTTPEQMKMFLTRLGFGSKMVITGDVTQIDLPNGQHSGLRVVRDILKDIDDIAFLELTAEDVVRHRLIGDIVKAYDKFDEAKQALRPKLNPECDLNLGFIDDQYMTELHIKWMDEPGSTDVLSFPMDMPEVEGEIVTLGDIMISPTFAAAQALTAGHSTEHEIYILATHGLLHIIGYDHAEPEEEKIMFALQEQIVEKWKQTQ